MYIEKIEREREIKWESGSNIVPYQPYTSIERIGETKWN